MSNHVTTTLLSLLLAPMLLPAGSPDENGSGVQLIVKEAERRADVLIAGQPFTSYIWPATLKKPVLYPIRTARGTLVTRGFPLDPRPGERVDHPHHVGLWFNYGNVDGYDFWNNSDAIALADRNKMGTIIHRAVTSARSGAAEGVLETDCDWAAPDGTVLLKEHTKYVFHGTATVRTIERITTLTAGTKRVPMPDNKEGMLGLRVTRALEHPSDKPEVFTDAEGRPTAVAKLDNTGVTGRYLTSEGKAGDAAWGTRGRWCVLSGTVGTEPVAIAILDHPSNVGYPTYWHARGYGLFAANPLGQKDLSAGKDVLDYALDAGQTVTFRHRIEVISGTPSAGDVNASWKRWVR
jgi:Methane oxygenase PmoA